MFLLDEGKTHGETAMISFVFGVFFRRPRYIRRYEPLTNYDAYEVLPLEIMVNTLKWWVFPCFSDIFRKQDQRKLSESRLIKKNCSQVVRLNRHLTWIIMDLPAIEDEFLFVGWAICYSWLASDQECDLFDTWILGYAYVALMIVIDL